MDLILIKDDKVYHVKVADHAQRIDTVNSAADKVDDKYGTGTDFDDIYVIPTEANFNAPEQLEPEE